MTTAIVKHQQGLVATNVAELEQMGKMCAASGFFQDARQAAQAMVKIAAGQELGLLPIQSMTGIHVINNRVTLSANLMASLLKKAGYRWKMARFDDQECSLVMFDPSGAEVGPSSFSMADAKKAGLSGGNWAKYPRNMLFARAISNAARWYAPEVITGCYTPEEMGAGIIDTEVSCVEPVRETTPVHEPVREEDDVDVASDGTAEAAEAEADNDYDRELDRCRKAFFAEASKKGLTEDQQRALLGVSSRKDATADRLHHCTTALKEWGKTERELALACLEAPTVQEMRDIYRSLPKIAQELLARACQFRSRVLEAT